MRVLHTSDWHLGQLFYQHDRSGEHQQFFSWLLNVLLEEKIDLLLVSGDIYHTATPPTQAENQLYEFIKQANQLNPQLHIVLIAGNHDSAKRITTAKPLLAQFNTHVVGRFDFLAPEQSVIHLKIAEQTTCILAIPFIRQSDILDSQLSYAQAVKKAYSLAYQTIENTTTEATSVIAMGHLHAKGASVSEDSERNLIIGGEEAIGADAFPKEVDYVALGHLHKAQQVNKCEHIRYSGTPFAMSFSERNYQHQVLILQFSQGKLQSVNPLYTPRFRDTILLPEKEILSLEKLCEQLTLLKIDKDSPPYLRLRLSAQDTQSDFREQIDTALKDKTVYFCGIERVRSQKVTKGELVFDDLTKVEKLSADQVLNTAFKQHKELQESQITEQIRLLFNELVKQVDEEQQQ